MYNKFKLSQCLKLIRYNQWFFKLNILELLHNFNNVLREIWLETLRFV